MFRRACARGPLQGSELSDLSYFTCAATTSLCLGVARKSRKPAAWRQSREGFDRNRREAGALLDAETMREWENFLPSYLRATVDAANTFGSEAVGFGSGLPVDGGKCRDCVVSSRGCRFAKLASSERGRRFIGTFGKTVAPTSLP